MNGVYRLSNLIVGVVVVTALGATIWNQLTTMFANAEGAIPAAAFAVSMVSVIVVGWFLLESRKC